MSDIAIVGLDEQQETSIDPSRWVDLARAVLQDEGVKGTCELNLTFIDVEEMTALNIEHMDGDGPTDVLSFPLDSSPSDVFEDQPRLLGDILICPSVVADHAPFDVDGEMALMVVHGVLHILGMDHQDPEETAEMKAAEHRHLRRWRESA